MQVYIRRVLPLYENGGIVMAWVAVDMDGTEYIYNAQPSREETRFMSCFDCIHIPKGSIKKLIGRELSWNDEPVELKRE